MSRKQRLAAACCISFLVNGLFWLAYGRELRRSGDAVPHRPDTTAALKPVVLGRYVPLPPLVKRAPEPARDTPSRMSGAETADKAGGASQSTRTGGSQASAGAAGQTGGAQGASGSAGGAQGQSPSAKTGMGAAARLAQGQTSGSGAAQNGSSGTEQAGTGANGQTGASGAANHSQSGTGASPTQIAGQKTAGAGTSGKKLAQGQKPSGKTRNAPTLKETTALAAEQKDNTEGSDTKTAEKKDEKNEPLKKPKPTSAVNLKIVKMWTPKPGQKFNLASSLNITLPKNLELVPGPPLTSEQIEQLKKLLQQQKLRHVGLNRKQLKKLLEARRTAESKRPPEKPKPGDDARKRERERQARKPKPRVPRPPANKTPKLASASMQRPRSPFTYKQWNSDMFKRWAPREGIPDTGTTQSSQGTGGTPENPQNATGTANAATPGTRIASNQGVPDAGNTPGGNAAQDNGSPDNGSPAAAQGDAGGPDKNANAGGVLGGGANGTNNPTPANQNGNPPAAGNQSSAPATNGGPNTPGNNDDNGGGLLGGTPGAANAGNPAAPGGNPTPGNAAPGNNGGNPGGAAPPAGGKPNNGNTPPPASPGKGQANPGGGLLGGGTPAGNPGGAPAPGGNPPANPNQGNAGGAVPAGGNPNQGNAGGGLLGGGASAGNPGGANAPTGTEAGNPPANPGNAGGGLLGGGAPAGNPGGSPGQGNNQANAGGGNPPGNPNQGNAGGLLGGGAPAGNPAGANAPGGNQGQGNQQTNAGGGLLGGGAPAGNPGGGNPPDNANTQANAGGGLLGGGTPAGGNPPPAGGNQANAGGGLLGGGTPGGGNPPPAGGNQNGGGPAPGGMLGGGAPAGGNQPPAGGNQANGGMLGGGAQGQNANGGQPGGTPGGMLGGGQPPAQGQGQTPGGNPGVTGDAGQGQQQTASANGGMTGDGSGASGAEGAMFLGGEQGDGMDADAGENEAQGNTEDTGFAPAVSSAPDLPAENPNAKKGIPGSLVLPPSPPMGTTNGKLPTPRPVKKTLIQMATEGAPAAQGRQATRPLPSSAPRAPQKMAKTPVGMPTKPRRKAVRLALTVGSTSANGTIPFTVMDRPYLPVGSVSDAVDPPLPPAKGTPKSPQVAPKSEPARSEKATRSVRPNKAGKPVAAKQASPPVVRTAKNSQGIKNGTEQPLPPTPLPDSDMEVGDGSGLKGQYYLGRKFDQYQFTRADPMVDFDWKPGQSPSPRIPSGTDYTIRWTGKIQPKYSETYTFYATVDDGVRIWIDHHLIIDDWTLHAATQFSNTISLQAGHQYLFKVEYLESAGGAATVQLYWESPSQPKEFIPEDAFFYPLPGDEEDMKRDKAPL